MVRFRKSKGEPEQRIDEMVEQASHGKLSRRHLVTSLAAVGVTASATATIVAAAEWIQREQHNIQKHDQHLATQKQAVNSTRNTVLTEEVLNAPALRGRLDAVLQDYHPDAVVEDMLSLKPIKGYEAIRLHKAQEFLSFSNLDFQITRRYAVGGQLIAEWVASGILNGEFKGLIGNGESFEIPGVTVVSRDAAGKIVKESIYYNLSHVQRYLRFTPVSD
jgi:hypothetical protein